MEIRKPCQLSVFEFSAVRWLSKRFLLWSAKFLFWTRFLPVKIGLMPKVMVEKIESLHAVRIWESSYLLVDFGRFGELPIGNKLLQDASQK